MTTKTKEAEKTTNIFPSMQDLVNTGNYFDLAHKLFRANLGAVALAQDEVQAFVNKLVERGEVAEQDSRKMVDDYVQRTQDVMGAQTQLTKQVESVVQTLNVPTKKDIDALSVQIEALTKKVDELKKAKAV